MNRTPNTNNARHRAVRTLAGLGIFAIGLSTAVGSAAATNEFPANPDATISASCTTWLGGVVHIDYTNVGGLSDAVFTTTVNGTAIDQVVLAPNDTSSKEAQVPDGVVVPVTITAPDMPSISTTVGPLTCHSGTSTIQVDCVNNAPVMTATATNTGKTMTTAIFVVNGNNAMSSQASVAPGTTYTFTAPLPDGVPYTGDISFIQNQGVGSSIAGTPSCVPPTTQTTLPPTTTVPPTTAAPTTTVPPAVQVDAPTTVPLTAPPAAVLPSTGKSSATIAWIAALALAFGALIVRAARRPRSVR